MEAVSIVISSLILLAIIAGVLVARKELRLTSDTRKAEFLNVLDQRFCTEAGFAEIRGEIRSGNFNINANNEMKVWNYLGFFEVLNVFRKRRILNDDEIYSQFGVYILEARNDKGIDNYLESNEGYLRGFCELSQRMEEISTKLAQRGGETMQRPKDNKGKK